MAEQKKGAAAVKNKNTKKTNTNNKNSKKSSENKSDNMSDTGQAGMRKELVMIIMVGIAVMLFAFLINGSSENAGIIGRAVASILLGILGMGAWILPVALIIGAIYLATEKSDAIFKIRAAFSFILFLTIIAFVHSFGGIQQYDNMSLPGFISYSFRHGEGSNGGLVGALLYAGLYKLVGNVGFYIIIILLAIIMVMLISGGSVIGCIRSIISYADNIRYKYIDYYYEDDEDYYEDTDIPQKPAKEEQEIKSGKRSTRRVHQGENQDRVLTLDIKKSNKRENKISLITDELYSYKDENSQVDLTGIIDMLDRNKNSVPLEDEPSEQIISNTSELQEGELPQPIKSFVENEPKQMEAAFYTAEKTPVEKATPESNKQDRPPWEEPYSSEEEPEIIEAEKTKLVDKLEVEKKKTEYKFPKLEFLGVNKNKSAEKTKEEILRKAKKLEETLAIFKVEAKVNNISIGPTVTRYELTPSTGTKVSAVTNLENDIKFSMAAESIIIEAPIPGKSAIGIEIPNDTRESVYFSEVLRSEQFQKFKSKIAFGLGKDITGSVTVADLAKMPHLLVAGTTGSGKSVCINTLIMSILYKATPDEVKMIMVDPKMVELSVYNGIPHLLLPVVTEPEKAAGALNWAVIEMERRYKLLAKSGTRNIEGYNQKVNKDERLSQIVIIIDELADLMMVVGKEIETSICRLAQKARAAGMHLVLATQRPSADVLTGLIRSNVPSRIAFKVSGSMDSRIILDSTGAEKLLGKGDMLFKTADMAKPMRIQGAFITDDEVERVVNYIGLDEPNYDETIINEITKASITVTEGADGGDEDPMTEEVLEWIVSNPKGASAGKVQRHFRIGFNRASRIIETLEERGILGPTNGSQPREVLMDKYELRERKERYDSYNDY